MSSIYANPTSKDQLYDTAIQIHTLIHIYTLVMGNTGNIEMVRYQYKFVYNSNNFDAISLYMIITYLKM